MESSRTQLKAIESDSTALILPDLSGIQGAERAKLELEKLKLRVDTYKWRADEYRGRYEGLRTLEWNTILQMYAGYAAIALAFNYVKELDSFKGWHPLVWIAVGGTSIFYFATRYLSYRIQERLVCFGDTQENYSNKLGEVLYIDQPNPGTDALRHSYYWTYDTQLVLSTITFAGLIGYELSISGVLPMSLCTGAALTLLTFGLVLIFMIRTPTPRPKGKPGDSNTSNASQTNPGGEHVRSSG